MKNLYLNNTLINHRIFYDILHDYRCWDSFTVNDRRIFGIRSLVSF